ncbi:MAG: DUF2334 domain-containing protein [Lachnospiraceae bacterium]|nr:DUF2334 domain-containing protein [Lachnospiraceae bacterium]
MRIAIRLDDISIDMNWEKFYRFKALIDEFDIKPLIGVIPDNKDQMLKDFREDSGVKFEGDFWAYIRGLQAEGWTVAMHGLNHVYTTNKSGMFPLNNFSEYSGLSYEKQYEMIKQGKEILIANGIETDIFMAPAHNYDKNTLKALKENGFVKITDGFGIRPYEYKGITFYPISYRKSKTIRKSLKIEYCENNQDMVINDNYSTLVFHTNTMNEMDFQNAKGIFECNKCISYGEYLKGNTLKQGFIDRIREYVMAKMKHILTNR